jgi:hypothetical protein
MVAKYSYFVLQVMKAWRFNAGIPARFTISDVAIMAAGETIKLRSKMNSRRRSPLEINWRRMVCAQERRDEHYGR